MEPDQHQPVVPPGAESAGASQNLPDKLPEQSTKEANRMRGEEPKKNNNLMIAVLIFVVLAVIIGAGFILFTPQGRNLIGLGSNLPPNNNDTTPPAGDVQEEVPDYSSSTGSETVDDILDELDQTIELGEPTSDFDDFDTKVEFDID